MNVLTRAHALGIAAGASRVPTTCQAPWGARYLCDPVWSQRHLSSVRSIRITTSVAISQMRTVKFPRGRGNRGQSRDSRGKSLTPAQVCFPGNMTLGRADAEAPGVRATLTLFTPREDAPKPQTCPFPTTNRGNQPRT